ncbi:MAG: endolytic transglycosylase MltG [Candidatus Dormibacter sp.]
MLLLVVGGGALLYGRSQLDPRATTADADVTISVQAGEPVATLVSDLSNHQLIRSAFWFGWYAKLQGLGSKLVGGNFVLNDAMSASYIVQRLEGPPQVATHQLLLTEGLTAKQMAARVAAAGLGISSAQYMTEAQSGSFSEPFLGGRPSGASLEGFLFPDTYTVPDHVTAHDIVQMQLADFAKKAMPQLAGMSAQQVYAAVTVASMIEREAKFSADRPLVASVVANRLANGMRLQIDSTVLYGLGLTSGSLTSDQLATDTPYNTYRHTGLPPTPIANPGAGSIAGAAHPANTPYLYYLSDCSGHNHYSVTGQEHDQQIQQYLSKPCGT